MQRLDKNLDATTSAGGSDNIQHFRPLFVTFSSESEQYSKTFRKFVRENKYIISHADY